MVKQLVHDVETFGATASALTPQLAQHTLQLSDLIEQRADRTDVQLAQMLTNVLALHRQIATIIEAQQQPVRIDE
ncbi:hypothetical protein ACJBPR_11120, partial [Streptococcus suis]